MPKITIEIKCNECGKTLEIQKAKKEWFWTSNRNVYCPRCIIKLARNISNK